ncbi:SRPBCC family protein [Actinacidiphila acididurans]|uniref:SRPBCC family protein n=1 Tax=Actinacidiphila acididurans TaxID=2784346 RepID=A0ABS2TTL0_9ACTN|nr:SRPBCC family protein [Actinacidiphila acididurans]MBM9506326.1 SRPBCC family protein [Actinacidiphila acididurans]
MPESTTGTLKDTLTRGPEADRLKEELFGYLQARTRKTVAGLGDRLGRGVTGLGEQGVTGLAGPLAKGVGALRDGGSPTRAVAAAGTEHLKDKVKGGFKGLLGKIGKKSKGGGGKSKSVTVVEDIDVGVPVREAYDQWSRFQDFSTFAKGVVNVERADDTTSNWTVKVAKSTRSWKANVTEQVPDERIAWTTEGAKGKVRGVVTFHPLGENLTRVLLVLEYFPKGLFEKTGNIWRAQGRRARLDLKLYRKYVMTNGGPEDGWRGEIHDGEVTTSHEDAVAEEERRDQDEDDGADEPDGPDAEAAEDDRDRDDDEARDAEDEDYADDPDADEPADEEREDDLPRDELPDDEYDEDVPDDERPEDIEDEADDRDLAESEDDRDAEDYADEDEEADDDDREPRDEESDDTGRARTGGRRRRTAAARR